MVNRYLKEWVLLLIIDIHIIGKYRILSIDVKLGLIVPQSHPLFGWDVTAAGVTLAINQAKSDGLIDDVNISIVYKDDMCEPSEGSSAILELTEAERVNAILGPACTSSAEIVGFIAGSMDLPLFTHAAAGIIRDQENRNYRTLVRAEAPFEAYSEAIVEMLIYFNWKNVFLLYSNSFSGRRGIYCSLLSNILYPILNINRINRTWAQFEDDLSDSAINDLLNRAKNKLTIIVICAEKKDEHRILLRARALGMTNGEYLYILSSFYQTENNHYPWRENLTSVSNSEAILHNIYKNVLQVTFSSHQGADVDNFRNNITRNIRREPWNYNGPEKIGVYQAVNLYDVSYLYCLVLNRTRQNGGDFRSGTDMFNNARNRSFPGVYQTIHLDENCDKIPIIGIWQMDENDEEHRIWAIIDMSKEEESDQRIQILHNSNWNTENNQVPVDRPQSDGSSSVVVVLYIIVAILSTLIIMIAIYMFIRWKGQTVEYINWEIPFKDIQFVKSAVFPLDIKRGSVKSNRSFSFTGLSIDDDFLDNKYAIYKGVKVFVVHISSKKAITISKEEQAELTMMRQLTHYNVNQFIGLTILEASHLCILSQYCSRGSLQDIIANDQIKLDVLLKKSLLNDLINGLLYIHASSIKSHGHLTSDDCLIDNHWVLKIDNYGIQRIRNLLPDETHYGQYQKFKNLLWTAPELLGDLSKPEIDFTEERTREGDIYSLGMIMQEVVYRCMPYGDEADPEAVVRKLTDDPSFRPDLIKISQQQRESTELHITVDLMKDCWQVNPDDRPKISMVKKEFQKGLGKKLTVVNMFDIMEIYANDLEISLEKCKRDLKEERLRTETLLYSMLPPKIADFLKTGKTVHPETYHSVTLLCSSILEFSSLCAENTAGHIVLLVNELHSIYYRVISCHDVIQVETIGDAYMVASGVPNRNGNSHAFSIAKTAIDLMQALNTSFPTLAHRVRKEAGYKLPVQVGIHTGSCLAGLVGITLPRFCLFGATVDVVFEFKTTSKPLKIHMSKPTCNILREAGGFAIKSRGFMKIDGIGLQETFWLLGKDDQKYTELDNEEDNEIELTNQFVTTESLDRSRQSINKVQPPPNCDDASTKNNVFDQFFDDSRSVFSEKIKSTEARSKDVLQYNSTKDMNHKQSRDSERTTLSASRDFSRKSSKDSERKTSKDSDRKISKDSERTKSREVADRRKSIEIFAERRASRDITATSKSIIEELSELTREHSGEFGKEYNKKGKPTI